ncbi:MAG TPA: hypothetical protein VGN86_17215 [Pyrinomonadaceae bacterium]|jgi:hypothetical protein|nr:hypothetical protein [Pyrinomonadaceae bacterium]
MQEALTRFVHDLFGRLDGPLHFRIILQPVMAGIFAIRDGLKDAQAGRPAYFWSLFTEPTLRRDLLRTEWKSVSKIFVLAVVLDVIYQLIVLRWVYPFETLLVAALLAFVPYLLLRGPVNRIKRSLRKVPSASASPTYTKSKM